MYYSVRLTLHMLTSFYYQALPVSLLILPTNPQSQSFNSHSAKKSKALEMPKLLI